MIYQSRLTLGFTLILLGLTFSCKPTFINTASNPLSQSESPFADEGPGPITKEVEDIISQNDIGKLQVYWKEKNTLISSTGIFTAISNNDLASVREYVSQKRPWQLPSIQGQTTLLHEAVKKDKHAIVNFLLTFPENQKMLGESYHTVIYQAQSPQMLNKLLDVGMDPFKSSDYGNNYFNELAIQGNILLLESIFEHSKTRQKAQRLKNDLLNYIGNKATLMYLMGKGVDLKHPLKSGTLLTKYPIYTDLDLVKLALSHNIDPNMGNSNSTPLMNATSLEIFDYLLQNGARISTPQVSTDQLFTQHLKNENWMIIDYLLENHRDSLSLNELLNQAILKLNYSAVFKLIKAGAVTEKEIKDNEDPYGLRENGSLIALSILKLIEEKQNPSDN